MASEGTSDFVRVICAYFIPPLGVFLQVGLGTHFWINLILTFMGGFPGILHALWVIASVGENGEESPEPMPTFIALVLAGLLPPVAAFMRGGVVAALINCVLCLFFWAPGMLHAAWITVHANTAEA